MTTNTDDRLQCHISVVVDVDPSIPVHQLDAISEEIRHEVSSLLEHTEVDVANVSHNPRKVEVWVKRRRRALDGNPSEFARGYESALDDFVNEFVHPDPDG